MTGCGCNRNRGHGTPSPRSPREDLLLEQVPFFQSPLSLPKCFAFRSTYSPTSDLQLRTTVARLYPPIYIFSRKLSGTSSRTKNKNPVQTSKQKISAAQRIELCENEMRKQTRRSKTVTESVLPNTYF